MSVGLAILILSTKGQLMTPNAIVFYNGFNLLLDIIFVYIAYRIGKSIGYRQGEADNQPPF